MENKDKNIGCGQALGYLSAGILILIVIAGALDGITEALADIPWYLGIFLSIGFMFLMFKMFGN